MAEEIDGWLQDLGLGKYVDAFVDNEITLDELPALTEDDLKELGLPMGPRRRVLMAIDALGDPSGDTAIVGDAGEVLSPEPASAAPVERRQLTILFCDRSAQPRSRRRLIRKISAMSCAAIRTRWRPRSPPTAGRTHPMVRYDLGDRHRERICVTVTAKRTAMPMVMRHLNGRLMQPS